MTLDLEVLNRNYSERNLDEPNQIFESLKVYKDKLHTIKKQMSGIHQRVKTLKVIRAEWPLLARTESAIFGYRFRNVPQI